MVNFFAGGKGRLALFPKLAAYSLLGATKSTWAGILVGVVFELLVVFLGLG